MQILKVEALFVTSAVYDTQHSAVEGLIFNFFLTTMIRKEKHQQEKIQPRINFAQDLTKINKQFTDMLSLRQLGMSLITGEEVKQVNTKIISWK